MNAEIKREWVACLRSGDYKQGKDALKNPDGEFCPLGVLCDMYSQQFGIPWDEEDKKFDAYIMGEVELLPAKVSEWASVARDPKISSGRIIDLNDFEGFSFAEIADLIEKEL